MQAFKVEERTFGTPCSGDFKYDETLREDPPTNQAILKYESTSTPSDFVYISHGATFSGKEKTG